MNILEVLRHLGEKEHKSKSPFFRNSKDSLVRQWAEQKQGEYRLQKDGSLQVNTVSGFSTYFLENLTSEHPFT